ILQDREQKIRQIGIEVETVPLRRKSLEAQLAASKARVEMLKQRARQVEMDRKKFELDVGTRTEAISRLKTQQYQTRKNDEFQAIEHEVCTGCHIKVTARTAHRVKAGREIVSCENSGRILYEAV